MNETIPHGSRRQCFPLCAFSYVLPLTAAVQGGSIAMMAAFLRSVPLPVFLPLLLVAALFVSCAPPQPTVLEREVLFELGIGRLEHELGIFATRGVLPTRVNTLTVQNGIVHISNGSSNKVLSFTSYGDLLRLIYDPAINPRPVSLRDAPGTRDDLQVTRQAVAFPFQQVGHLVVDSRRIVYVADHVAAEREEWDPDLRVMLNRQVLRFGANGNPLDYIGQEGVGGSPFPMIDGVFLTQRDELVVVGSSRDARLVWLYSPAGEKVFSARIDLDRLPVPAAGAGYVPVLDTIIPGIDGYRVYLKISYYRTVAEQSGGRDQGIVHDHSRVYWLDLTTGRYEGFMELPRRGDSEDAEHFELAGVARGGHMLFVGRLDAQRSQLIIMDSNGGVLRRRVLEIPERDLLVRSFFVTPAGILTALLAYPEHAEVVWWRSDQLLPGQS